jgi:hypothetical protein
MSVSNLPSTLASLAILALLAIVGGCGGSADGRLPVSGAVTLDGTPLDQGVIAFHSEESGRPPVETAITAGEYFIPADKGLLPGSYKVAIDSADSTGKTASPVEYSMAIPVSRIPLKYNGETTLVAAVDAAADNVFNFQLETGR